MIKFFSHAFALLLLAPLTVQPQQPVEKFEQGLLWRVEQPGTAPSHVFGTMHLADKRITTLPVAVVAALDNAQSFTMEASLDPDNIAALSRAMIYTKGRNLPGVAGPKLFGQAAALLQCDYGVPPEIAQLFKPWAVLLMLSVPPQQPKDVLDAMLYARALQQHKSLHYLESMQEQIAVFDELPEARQVEMLQATVDSYSFFPQQREAMIRTYLARDLGAMEKISKSKAGSGLQQQQMDAFEKRLLDNRNVIMAERMQPQLRRGKAFVGIGALHLYGERGVLSLLQRAGWRITRVY